MFTVNMVCQNLYQDWNQIVKDFKYWLPQTNKIIGIGIDGKKEKDILTKLFHI